MGPLTHHQIYEVLFWKENGFDPRAIASQSGLPFDEVKKACTAFHWRGTEIPCRFVKYLQSAPVGPPFCISQLYDVDGDESSLVRREDMKLPAALRDAMARPDPNYITQEAWEKATAPVPVATPPPAKKKAQQKPTVPAAPKKATVRKLKRHEDSDDDEPAPVLKSKRRIIHDDVEELPPGSPPPKALVWKVPAKKFAAVPAHVQAPVPRSKFVAPPATEPMPPGYESKEDWDFMFAMTQGLEIKSQ